MICSGLLFLLWARLLTYVVPAALLTYARRIVGTPIDIRRARRAIDIRASYCSAPAQMVLPTCAYKLSDYRSDKEINT